MNFDNLNLFIGIAGKPLEECSPGVLLDSDGNIVFKTEYSEVIQDEAICTCYNSAGEYWHGNRNQLFYEIKVE